MEKNSFGFVAIVAIVAIVGLVILVNRIPASSTGFSMMEDGNVAGQARTRAGSCQLCTQTYSCQDCIDLNQCTNSKDCTSLR